MALSLVIITVMLIGCTSSSNKDEGNPVPIENAVAVYDQAVAQLSAEENIYYKVTGTRMISDNGISTEESFTQLITYENRGSKDFTSCVEEDLQIGSHAIKSFEFFSKDVAYFTTQGANFQSEMTADDYTDRYTPVAPVDSSLYAQITGTKNRKAITISFEKAGSVASWVEENGIALIDSSATATLTADGELRVSNYSVTYTKDALMISLDVTVEIMNNAMPPLQIPDSSAYAPISDISIPKTLERSCGYLTAINKIRSDYSETIFCEAFGDKRIQTISLAADRTDSLSAELDTVMSVSNSSKAGAVTTYTKKELFKSGVYTYSVDGITFENDSSVGKDIMQSYCDSLLIGTVMLPDYIGSVNVEEADGVISISFLPTEEFANILAQDACLSLYQNGTVLIEQALSYKTDEVTCYLTIDKASGYPLSSGFYYSGTYIVGGIPYQLSFQADQTYDYTATAVDEEESTEPTEYTKTQETEVS